MYFVSMAGSAASQYQLKEESSMNGCTDPLLQRGLFMERGRFNWYK